MKSGCKSHKQCLTIDTIPVSTVSTIRRKSTIVDHLRWAGRAGDIDGADDIGIDLVSDLLVRQPFHRLPAPRRLVLGSDAYQAISKALAERIAEIRAQKETAPLTDLSAV